MAADVVEAADPLVLAADEQDALVGELHAQPAARPRDALSPSDVDPVAVENPLLVEAPSLIGVVRHPGQRLADRPGHSLTVQSVSDVCHPSPEAAAPPTAAESRSSRLSRSPARATGS